MADCRLHGAEADFQSPLSLAKSWSFNPAGATAELGAAFGWAPTTEIPCVVNLGGSCVRIQLLVFVWAARGVWMMLRSELHPSCMQLGGQYSAQKPLQHPNAFVLGQTSLSFPSYHPWFGTAILGGKTWVGFVSRNGNWSLLRWEFNAILYSYSEGWILPHLWSLNAMLLSYFWVPEHPLKSIYFCIVLSS